MIEFLALLVLMGLVWYVGTRMIHDVNEEGFQNEIPYLSACPRNMISYYLSDGRPACCDGPLTDGRCRFEEKCVMTGTGTA